jgi:hypothetical protein
VHASPTPRAPRATASPTGRRCRWRSSPSRPTTRFPPRLRSSTRPGRHGGPPRRAQANHRGQRLRGSGARTWQTID